MHRGIDIVGETGQPIWATADGVVVFAGVKGGYGLSIEIDHGNGYTTFYGHNKSNLVIEGDTVTRGTTIALMGSTGRSTGTHLHYEVRKDGVPINPDGFMLIE
jgi:murein DD-endopeptidase MepM/ murein hydrolase activator NlpD